MVAVPGRERHVSRTFIALDGEKRCCGVRVAWKEPKRSIEEILGELPRARLP